MGLFFNVNNLDPIIRNTVREMYPYATSSPRMVKIMDVLGNVNPVNTFTFVDETTKKSLAVIGPYTVMGGNKVVGP